MLKILPKLMVFYGKLMVYLWYPGIYHKGKSIASKPSSDFLWYLWYIFPFILYTLPSGYLFLVFWWKSKAGGYGGGQRATTIQDPPS